MLKSAKSSIKLNSHQPSEAVKSLGQMEAFQIIHEALRAPRRQTLTASFPSVKTRGRVTFTTIFPVAGLADVSHIYRIGAKKGKEERRGTSYNSLTG